MKNRRDLRDERTIAVENASYRWGYVLISFGLLLIVAYRGFANQEANWDLLALVILSGAITTIYQAAERVVARGWLLLAVVTAVLAAVVAAAIALLA